RFFGYLSLGSGCQPHSRSRSGTPGPDPFRVLRSSTEILRDLRSSPRPIYLCDPGRAGPTHATRRRQGRLSARHTRLDAPSARSHARAPCPIRSQRSADPHLLSRTGRSPVTGQIKGEYTMTRSHPSPPTRSAVTRGTCLAVALAVSALPACAAEAK